MIKFNFISPTISGADSVVKLYESYFLQLYRLFGRESCTNVAALRNDWQGGLLILDKDRP